MNSPIHNQPPKDEQATEQQALLGVIGEILEPQKPALGRYKIYGELTDTPERCLVAVGKGDGLGSVLPEIPSPEDMVPEQIDEANRLSGVCLRMAGELQEGADVSGDDFVFIDHGDAHRISPAGGRENELTEVNVTTLALYSKDDEDQSVAVQTDLRIADGATRKVITTTTKGAGKDETVVDIAQRVETDDASFDAKIALLVGDKKTPGFDDKRRLLSEIGRVAIAMQGSNADPARPEFKKSPKYKELRSHFPDEGQADTVLAGLLQIAGATREQRNIATVHYYTMAEITEILQAFLASAS